MKKKLGDFIGFIVCAAIIFGIISATIAMVIVDHFMTSVSASLLSIFAIAFLFVGVAIFIIFVTVYNVMLRKF